MISRVLPILLLCIASFAWAKLPPPSPEEQAAAAQKKAQQQAQAEEQKKALEQAQDRVAESYKRNHSTASGASAGSTEQKDLPKATRVLPGEAGPQAGREPSAEAHSAPAH